MDASEVTEVCRLCPVNSTKLISVFDERFSGKNNMKEVILVTTGIEILPTDIVSQKICRRCYRNVRKIHEIVQSAIKHDQDLKEKCQQYIENKGLHLPNTCITIKKDNRVLVQKETQPNDDVITPKPEPCIFAINNLKNIQEKTSPNKKASPLKKKKGPRTIHSSIIDVYRKYPYFKLPKKCLDRHIAPIVSFAMGEVETYFKNKKLDMSKYIYRPRRINRREEFDSDSQSSTSAKSQTASPASRKSMIIRTTAANEIAKNQEFKTTDDVFILDDSPSSNKRKLLIGKDPSLKIKKISVETPSNSTLIFDQLLANSSSDQITASTQDDPPNASKPDFIQSLGLTPATEEAVSQNSLTCQICNSVQANISALKKHISRHRVCSYCKLKFKSIETKQLHVEHNCPMGKSTPGQFGLGKNENVDARQHHDEAIPSTEKNSQNCIYLSDNEEARVNDTLNPTDETTYVPVVSIYNDMTVDGLENKLSDIKVIKAIAKILRNNPDESEEEMQILLPRNEDILMTNDKVRIKNLRNYLPAYMIPITFNNNEEFRVVFNREPREKKSVNKLDDWDNVPLIEKRLKNPTSQEIPLLNAVTFVTSQVQSLMMTSPAMSFILPNGSTFIPNTGISIQNSAPGQTIFGNTSIQTTPLLQNYTLSMTPVPMIQTSSNSKPKSSADSVVTVSTTTPLSKEEPSTSTSTRKSLPATVSMSKEVSVRKRRRSSPATKRSERRKSHRKRRQIIKVKIGNIATPKKVRVKNIWEK